MRYRKRGGGGSGGGSSLAAVIIVKDDGLTTKKLKIQSDETTTTANREPTIVSPNQPNALISTPISPVPDVSASALSQNPRWQHAKIVWMCDACLGENDECV